MFDDELDLGNLDGTNGFVIEGIAAGDAFGPAGPSSYLVSDAGDVNNDGFDDAIVAANLAQGEGSETSPAGETYIVFGGSSFESNFDLDGLDGNNGFTINGLDTFAAFSYAASAAGDINADGFDDIILGVSQAAGDSDGNSAAGEAFVVFGGTNFGSDFDLDDLNGSNGFTLEGFAPAGGAGFVVTGIGDINADGIDDVAIGAPGAANDAGDAAAGQIYVVFGRTGGRDDGGFEATLDLDTLDGSQGFTIEGAAAADNAGLSASAAGDVNGDGVADLIVGAPGADPDGNANAGTAYVIFGRGNDGRTAAVPFGSSLDLEDDLDGPNGFAIEGVASFDTLGFVVDGGDFNGDGIADILVGSAADSADGQLIGELSILFGSTQLGSGGAPGDEGTFDPDSLEGDDGLTITNLVGASDALLEGSIGFAGDVNGDGFDDLLVGRSDFDPDDRTDAGRVAILFGGSDVGSDGTFDFEGFDPSDGDGFFVEGLNTGDFLGSSVSAAGDINGDAADDFILAAPGGDPNEEADAGESYVVFGIFSGDSLLEAVDDTASTTAEATTVVDILANDSRSNDLPVTVSVGETRDGGLATLNDDGVTVTYDPNGAFDTLAAGQTDTDSFSYTVSSGTASATAIVTVTIAGVGPLLEASDDEIPDPLSEDGPPLTIAVADLLANDDPNLAAIASLDSGDTLGQVTLDGETITYDPTGAFDPLAAGEAATDTFAYTAAAADGTEATATVTVILTGTNDAPQASDDGGEGFATDEDTPFVTASILANDTDAEGDAFSIASIDTTGTLGLVTDNGDGTFSYDPNGQFESLAANETATDTFTYTLTDPSGSSSQPATVAIAVANVNDPPVPATTTVVSRVSLTAPAGAPILTVAGSDPDGDALQFALIDAGILDFDGDGQPALAIDAVTGTLQVNDGDDLPLAAAGLEATVSLTDTGSPALTASELVTVTVIPALDPSSQVAVAAQAAGSGLSASLGSSLGADLLSSSYAELALSAGGAEFLSGLTGAIATAPEPAAAQAVVVAALDVLV